MSLHEHNNGDRVKQPPMSYLILGKRALGQDQNEQPIFEARRELRCARCSGVIVVSEHFTKQRSPRSGPRNRKEHPCCQRCYPFEEVIDTRPPICY